MEQNQLHTPPFSLPFIETILDQWSCAVATATLEDGTASQFQNEIYIHGGALLLLKGLREKANDIDYYGAGHRLHIKKAAQKLSASLGISIPNGELMESQSGVFVLGFLKNRNKYFRPFSESKQGNAGLSIFLLEEEPQLAMKINCIVRRCKAKDWLDVKNLCDRLKIVDAGGLQDIWYRHAVPLSLVVATETVNNSVIEIIWDRISRLDEGMSGTPLPSRPGQLRSAYTPRIERSLK